MPIGGVVVFVVEKEKSPVTSYTTQLGEACGDGLPRMFKRIAGRRRLCEE